jgi:hypothetical protein
MDVPSLKDPAEAYRIRSYCRFGIMRLENGQWRELLLTLCIHPTDQYKCAIGDLTATYALLCEMKEEHLEKVANFHRCYAA